VPGMLPNLMNARYCERKQEEELSVDK